MKLAIRELESRLRLRFHGRHRDWLHGSPRRIRSRVKAIRVLRDYETHDRARCDLCKEGA